MAVHKFFVNAFKLYALTALLSMFAACGIAHGSEVTIATDIEDFRYSKIQTIPDGPNPKVSGSNCESWTVGNSEQRYIQSQKIESLGWLILSEVKFAHYTLIAFAGAFEEGTSATCKITQSNIAIFKNDNLQGIIYLSDPQLDKIGHLQLMENGSVRVFSGNYQNRAMAEIQLQRKGLFLSDISKTTPYCQGKTILPNTLGLSIYDGRQMLFDYGFLAVSQDATWERQYFSGIDEIVGCSNGIVWCQFEYKNEHSRVVLSTLGKEEIITDAVFCIE